ncbi:hypothetical protein J008_03892 [Cryptococcus neoformans]|uniref:TMEM205-like domain-containing protein n=2 Tax=Cryptococcus neoformans TaxID=5207 RepID=A0A854Q7L9_CRYNE|nr:hypothetical protein CNAG_05682 [Cryptococcus neoformans var. grubii H99]AUB25866.1 hypothetical protein CKF44_05682 [Cryptococcus neoformans var. grubii]OWT38575.1 hypothetical protein C362_03541 [Cryptococcus neoformans var. grubii Bt1]OWZ30416.1 hypothetical protein C347_04174 [Cryptococcus neoformans var. grubii AD2-60a]OWZ39301.1 hypothetical protein C353_04022 [Cryptococcus neoformans var. grubii AD1-83a]OWZ42189.1 hypothetical protein C343_04114 [Cryptococcus neoformans var. grubii C|eukprot:XP_012050451.1 hypothetical protein CNAG_05682 [Cryptococcus neoformans var. grubii H99]
MAVLQQALAPFTLKGFYLLTWGTALGSNVYKTLSSYRIFRALPRQTFGTLQSHLTPLYFSFSSITTSALLLTHLYFHPSLISSPRVEPHWLTSEEGRQGLLIVAGLVPQVLNWLVVGPLANSVVFERHRLERVEGKEYDEANPSDAMNKVNKKFTTLHTISSVLDTAALIALAGLGLVVSM